MLDSALDLAPYTAPPGNRSAQLSLERPVALPSSAPGGVYARDMKWFDSWVEHPATGLTPKRLMEAFRVAEAGFPQRQIDMFADLVEGDGHARNLFEHRERVVAKSPPVVNPADSSERSQAAARALNYALGRLQTKAAFEHLMRVNRDGQAGVEMDWGIVEFENRSWIVPVYLALVPARRFRIGTTGMMPVPGEEPTVRIDELRLYQDFRIPQGNPLKPGKWITLRRQLSQVARGGLMRTGASLIMGKRYSFRDWLILCERYGLPFPILQYDGAVSDQETLNLMREILQRIGSDGGAAISKEVDIKIVDGVKVKEALQATFIAYCNNELSKLVNGSTLRNDNSGSGGGSYGLGNVHDAVAWDELRADGEMLSEAVQEQLCTPFARFNGLASAPKFMLMVEPDLGPLEVMSLAVKMKNELGVEVSKSQVQQRTGLRDPIDDKDKCPGMTVLSFPTPAGGIP